METLRARQCLAHLPQPGQQVKRAHRSARQADDPSPGAGGIAFGLVGVALPLTMFTGTSQLTTVIHDGAALGAGLLIAVVFAKILAFALCEATGFIGGPILVLLFIGGTAGIAAHPLIPGLPEGLAFATMFAALVGSLVAAPFTLIVLVALTTQTGALQLAPVAIAVLTSYLAVSGSGALIALARKARKPARPGPQPAEQPPPSTPQLPQEARPPRTLAAIIPALAIPTKVDLRALPVGSFEQVRAT